MLILCGIAEIIAILAAPFYFLIHPYNMKRKAEAKADAERRKIEYVDEYIRTHHVAINMPYDKLCESIDDMIRNCPSNVSFPSPRDHDTFCLFSDRLLHFEIHVHRRSAQNPQL